MFNFLMIKNKRNVKNTKTQYDKSNIFYCDTYFSCFQKL